jgi:hypothetical protein
MSNKGVVDLKKARSNYGWTQDGGRVDYGLDGRKTFRVELFSCFWEA